MTSLFLRRSAAIAPALACTLATAVGAGGAAQASAASHVAPGAHRPG